MAASKSTVRFFNLPLGHPEKKFFGPPPDALTPEQKPVWTDAESIGGDLYSWQVMSRPVVRVTMRLQLTQAERDTLWDVYHLRLKGPTNPFSYEHTNGVIYNDVRWVGGWKETREPNAFSVEVTLRIVNQAIDKPTLVMS